MNAMAQLNRRVLPALTAIAFAMGVASCADPATDDEPLAQYIAVKTAWLPGERAAYIARVMTNHELVFPYVGDISFMAPEIFSDLDSHVVMAPNPALAPSLTAPMAGLSMAPQFNASWNFIGLKLTTVDNTNVPADTLFWHLALWSNPANPMDYGFAMASSRANTFNIRPINTITFDASGGTSGAGAGEFHASTGTYWEDDASGGRFNVTSQTYPGAFTTVTTGPFLGGLRRSGTQFGRVVNSNMVRLSGAEAPSTFTVSFDYRVTGIPSTEFSCVFPTPCTSNVPGLMAALRRASLPKDSP
jgi:hypothetical protein